MSHVANKIDSSVLFPALLSQTPDNPRSEPSYTSNEKYFTNHVYNASLCFGAAAQSLGGMTVVEAVCGVVSAESRASLDGVVVFGGRITVVWEFVGGVLVCGVVDWVGVVEAVDWGGAGG